MSLMNHILVRLGAFAALVVVLYMLAGNSASVWSFMLVGLIMLITNGAWAVWLGRNPRPAAGVRAPGWMLLGGYSLSKPRIAVAVVAGLVLAIPGVTLLAMMVIFPILFFMVIAVVTNFAPVVFFVGRSLQQHEAQFDFSPLVEAWVYCAILWLGSAFGLSRMGDAAASMGGKNAPLLEVFFSPWLMLGRALFG